MPIFNEISHIPLYIYDPRRKSCKGIRRKAIVQTMDLAPTLLEYFGVAIPKDMLGKPLNGVMDTDEKIRDYAVFWLSWKSDRYYGRTICLHVCGTKSASAGL